MIDFSDKGKGRSQFSPTKGLEKIVGAQGLRPKLQTIENKLIRS